MDRVLSTCAYCGTGCGLYLQVEGNQIVGIEPDPEHPVSKGDLCLKGYFGYQHIQDPRRLTTPLVLIKDRLVPVSWDEALDEVAERLTAIKIESGPDALAVFASARATNEEDYVAQKFARAVLGTNNVDNCARI